MSRVREAVLAAAVAVGLAFVFWQPLWFGGGLVGGDVYTYYFPQKQFFADRLADGEFPLWNDRTGFGYPLVGESQTAAFYPPNPLLYGTLSVNTAYNVSFLAHYVIAFAFTWLLARRLGIGVAGSLLTAIVFVYGWFPPRNCWEWAIVTGCWMPAAAWSAESYLRTRRLRYAITLAGVTGLQLLGGHFQLAFATHLLLGVAVPLRLWFDRDVRAAGTSKTCGVFAVAIGLGYALAAPQLLPSWELKQRSQRETAETSDDFQPAYGHLPPAYLSQVALPWLWYSGDTDAKVKAARFGAVDADTNKVEAHLYFGLLPLLLAVWGAVAPRFGFPAYDRRLWAWAIPGALAVVYATGWLMPVFQHVPGFAFFRGPGRYGIVTTLAVALLAGASLSTANTRVSRGPGFVLAGLMLAITACDLFAVSRLVRYSFFVPTPIVDLRGESVVGDRLNEWPSPPRLYAPLPNMPNVLGTSSLSVYLGIGPREYFEDWPELPDLSAAGRDGFVHASPEQVDWLQNAGVTHVLAFHDLALTDWPSRGIWSGRDRFLEYAYGYPGVTLFLHELPEAKPRIAFDGSSDGVEILERAANTVRVNVEAARDGQLVVRDLHDPGWTVTVDGEPAETLIVDRYFRGVDLPAGTHTVEWRYRPRTLFAGIVTSIVALLILAAAAHVAFWHPRWLRFLEASNESTT